MSTRESPVVPCGCSSCRRRASWSPQRRAAFDKSDRVSEAREQVSAILSPAEAAHERIEADAAEMIWRVAEAMP